MHVAISLRDLIPSNVRAGVIDSFDCHRLWGTVPPGELGSLEDRLNQAEELLKKGCNRPAGPLERPRQLRWRADARKSDGAAILDQWIAPDL
jgi:hypothetical protein